MSRPAVVLHERTGRWAAAIAQRLAEGSRAFRQTRTADELGVELSQAPTSIALIELAADRPDAALDLLARIGREFPGARLAMLADREASVYEGLARELGAAHFVASPREIGPLVGWIKRRSGRSPADEPAWIEEVRRRLPWDE